MSKRLAEHAAWDFVATHKCFELATICPSFVLGPVLSPRVDAESVKFMKALIDGSLKEVGGAAFGVIDVRNVAQAHIAAMTVDLETPGLRNSHGEARFILSSEDTFPQIEVWAASPFVPSRSGLCTCCRKTEVVYISPDRQPPSKVG